MSKHARDPVFDAVMGWTGVTTIFAWLPLVRIIGRPEGYTWGVAGLSGAGNEGPFWIFILGTAFVVTLLFTASRGPRALFRPMLVLWHVGVAALVVSGVVTEGAGATLQGQGLRFEIPLWILALPFTGFAALAVVWTLRDLGRAPPTAPPWSRENTVRLCASLALLAAALALFRAGTNYNWVTAAAILTTIAHWIMLILSFEALERSKARAA